MDSAPRHKLTEAQVAASADQDTGGDRERDEARQIAAKLHHLSSTDIFANLSPEERRWVAENVTMVTCEAGRVFYTPETTGEVAFILKRGRVNLYRLTEDGRKLVVATIEPHTIFGEMALVAQRMYDCYAESIDACLICVLSRADLHRVMERNPGVAIRLLEVLEQRLSERDAELEALAFRDMPTRLATLLLREADADGRVCGYSHQDLADHLGTYRETVSQALGCFREEGLVTTGPRKIQIVNDAGLRRHAEQ